MVDNAYEIKLKNKWRICWKLHREHFREQNPKLWKFELAIRGQGRAASQPICCQLKKDNDQCDL
jgi:hypothetical protein